MGDVRDQSTAADRERDGRTDAEIVTASLAAGEAFAELFDRHAVTVHRYLARRVGTAAAEDLLAQTFLVAFEQRWRYDADRPDALPWLYGIATNLLRRARRDEIRLYRALARSGVDPDVDGPADRVADRVDAAAATAALAGVPAALGPGDRDVLLLKAWGGLSLDEVALALGLPVGTVKSRLHRARSRLRSALPQPAGARRPARTDPRRIAMDELDLLARVRASVPEPDELALRRARHRLLERAAGPTPVDRRARRRRRSLPIPARVGVAAGLAVVVLGAGVVLTRPGSDDIPVGATPAAAEVLDRAAAAAERAAPAPVPGPGQYLYRRETGAQPIGTMGDLPVVGRRDHLCGSVHETWQPSDGASTWIRRTDGIVVTSGRGDPTRMPRDRQCRYGTFTEDMGATGPGNAGVPGPDFVAGLPTDPRQLYERFRRDASDHSLVDDETFTLLLDTARSASPWLTPPIVAALLRAMAYVPGIELSDAGTDATGRAGTVLGRTEAGRGTRREVVFDPATGQMLGERETVVDPSVAFGRPTCEPGSSCPESVGPVETPLLAGSVLWQSVITTAVVDRAGQRP